MRKSWDEACKDRMRKAAVYQAAGRELEIRLGLLAADGHGYSAKLLASLKTFAVSSGCAAADLTVAAREVVARARAKDSEITALRIDFEGAEKAENQAFRAYNVASSPGGPVNRLTAQLQDLRDRVSTLEDEIKMVPVRNEQAKARREEVRQETLGAQQTDSLLSMLASFSFEVVS